MEQGLAWVRWVITGTCYSLCGGHLAQEQRTGLPWAHGMVVSGRVEIQSPNSQVCSDVASVSFSEDVSAMAGACWDGDEGSPTDLEHLVFPPSPPYFCYLFQRVRMLICRFTLQVPSRVGTGAGRSLVSGTLSRPPVW